MLELDKVKVFKSTLNQIKFPNIVRRDRGVILQFWRSFRIVQTDNESFGNLKIEDNLISIWISLRNQKTWVGKSLVEATNITDNYKKVCVFMTFWFWQKSTEQPQHVYLVLSIILSCNKEKEYVLSKTVNVAPEQKFLIAFIIFYFYVHRTIETNRCCVVEL